MSKYNEFKYGETFYGVFSSDIIELSASFDNSISINADIIQFIDINANIVKSFNINGNILLD